MMMKSIKNTIFIIALLLVIIVDSTAQRHVSGRVRDASTGEVLIGANVIDLFAKKGTATDNNGYFSMVLGPGSDSLLCSYVGYTSRLIRFSEGRDTLVQIALESGTNLEEVSISAHRQVTFNQVKLSNKELRHIPAIGAEPDVLKSLQLLPGIQAPYEGSSNLLVRGGGPGQNLFLIDNVPLYYVNHLGGFVSVFNPDALNDVRIIKGGFPAKYGGKLSSVVDITMREGNNSESKGSFGIGVMGANLSLEGPLSDKLTYLFTARKTFTELLLGTVSLLSPEQDNMVAYGFYDLNGKLSWQYNDRNSFQAGIYIGDDYWLTRFFNKNETMKMKNSWGNVLTSLAWKSLLSPRLQVNNTLSFTRYRVKDIRQYEYDGLNEIETVFESKYRSLVRDLALKSDFRYRPFGAWSLDFGIQTSYQFFVPSEYEDNLGMNQLPREEIRALESALYLENHLNLGRHIFLNAGLRGVYYQTTDYGDYSLEPRLDLQLRVSPTQTFNATFMQGVQYAQMVFSSGEFLNNEVWVPTVEGMNPASALQYSMGWKGNFYKGMFSVELDVYHKEMKDLVTFKEGYANLHGDALWASKLEHGGVGLSQGVELYARKELGKWTGFMSYTFSHTTRQFENINDGQEYVYEYDRPHSFAIDIHRKLNEKWEINALWVFQSGLPYTPAIGRTYIPYTGDQEVDYNYEAMLYGERNSVRQRNYHRLDVGLHYKTKSRKGRDATWTFSVYNLYNRRNPYFYYYNTEPTLNFGFYGSDARNGDLKLYQWSFFPIIPSVSYKVSF